MVKCDRKDLLIHPLSSALLKSRWYHFCSFSHNPQFNIFVLLSYRDSYGSLVFKLNTLAYVIFLIFLTSAVALVTETGMPNTNATRNQTHIQEKTVIHRAILHRDDHNGFFHIAVFIWSCFPSHCCYIWNPSTD
jgi:hypothetical protein